MSFENLLQLKDKELQARFAESQKEQGGRWLPSNYLDELNRRAQNRLPLALVIATAMNAAAIIFKIYWRIWYSH
jgi:hypothetical protein